MGERLSRNKKRQNAKDLIAKYALQFLKCPNCGKNEAHFVPPSLGEKGFFICQISQTHPTTFSKS